MTIVQTIRTNVAVLCGYAAVSCGYFGWPLLHHPGRILIGTGRDPEIFVWSFAWWPHAIGSWTNPFVTHAVYAPTGINLAWTTSVPGLALAFSPLTILFGPDVSFNVAALLLPALAAWTAYLLCRHVTHSVWASVFGGYLFGFSSYALGEQVGGHLNLTGVFLLPLVALVLVRYVEGELAGRGLAVRLGVMLALQLSISTEVATTLTVFMALGLALAYWLLRDARPRLLSSLGPIVSAYGLGAILVAPLVYYTLRGFVPRSFGDPPFFGTDLLNFVIPTQATGVAGEHFASLTFHFPGNNDERGAYLGLPILFIAGAFAVRERHSARARFLVGSLVLCALLALGTALRIEGRRIVALPWALALHVPGLDNALPDRFAVFLSLAAAVIVAVWTASTKGWIYPRPYFLPIVAVVALVPAVWHPYYYSHPERWAFFTDGSYKCIPRERDARDLPVRLLGRLDAVAGGNRLPVSPGRGLPPLHAAPELPRRPDRLQAHLSLREPGRPPDTRRAPRLREAQACRPDPVRRLPCLSRRAPDAHLRTACKPGRNARRAGLRLPVAQRGQAWDRLILSFV